MPSMLVPKEGDMVLFCRHADVSHNHIDISREACADQPFHWYYIGVEDGPNMTRITPQGKQNRAISWVSCCNACYLANPELTGPFMGKEARWIGEPPRITND